MAVKYAKKQKRSQRTRERSAEIVSIQEARRVKAKGPQNLSMAWDDDYMGLSGMRTRDGGMLSERDRKDTYYKAYIGNPWVRACVQAISKRFTSGKWAVEEIEDGKGVEANRDKIKQLLLFVNPDEDFKQLLRSIAEDLGIFGEAFVEIVNGPDGCPAQLVKIDCCTMTTIFDMHGMVIKYVQSLEKNTQTQEFEPDQVIRFWFPDPRASKKALSPIECMKDSVYLYQAMITWGEKFFKQGAKPTFSIELGEDSDLDEANRFIKFFKENYMGIQNAHVPPVTYGTGKIVEFGKGSVELDFLKSLAWCRDEILAGYNVPLNVTGIQEAAHLGGGSGESANKLFVYNVVMPVEQLIMEKINYRVVQRGFNIFDWVITVSHADYRDDADIAKVQDTQIRNGSLTINEARAERGRAPVKGGDTAVIVASRDILPVERNAEIAGEQRQQAQLSLQGAKKALEAPAQDEQQQGKPGQQPPKQQAQDEEEQDQESPAKGKQAKESIDERAVWTTVAMGAAKIGDHKVFLEAVQALFGDDDEAARGRQKRLLEAKALLGIKDDYGQKRTQEARSSYDQEARETLAQYARQTREAYKQDEAPYLPTSIEARDPQTREDAPQASEAPTQNEADGSSPSEARTQDEEGREARHQDEATYEQESASSGEGSQESSEGTQEPRTETWSIHTEGGVKPRLQHWQDDDDDIQKQLAQLKTKGVTHLEWESRFNACDSCLMNHDQKVKLGKQFNSGAYITPNHGNCECETEEITE